MHRADPGMGEHSNAFEESGVPGDPLSDGPSAGWLLAEGIDPSGGPRPDAIAGQLYEVAQVAAGRSGRCVAPSDHLVGAELHARPVARGEERPAGCRPLD